MTNSVCIPASPARRNHSIDSSVLSGEGRCRDSDNESRIRLQLLGRMSAERSVVYVAAVVEGRHVNAGSLPGARCKQVDRAWQSGCRLVSVVRRNANLPCSPLSIWRTTTRLYEPTVRSGRACDKHAEREAAIDSSVPAPARLNFRFLLVVTRGRSSGCRRSLYL